MSKFNAWVGKCRAIAARAIFLLAVCVGYAPAYAAGVTIHRTFSTTVPLGGDIAWAGTSFYGFDSATIYEHDLNGNLLSSFPSPAGESGSTLDF